MCINDASLLAFFLVHLHSASRSVSSFKLVYGAGDRTRTALKGVGGERGGGGAVLLVLRCEERAFYVCGEFCWFDRLGKQRRQRNANASGEVRGAVFFFSSFPPPCLLYHVHAICYIVSHIYIPPLAFFSPLLYRTASPLLQLLPTDR